MARGQLEEAFACQTLVVQYPNVCVYVHVYNAVYSVCHSLTFEGHFVNVFKLRKKRIGICN